MLRYAQNLLVYPRLRGGSMQRPALYIYQRGLSPPTRGIRSAAQFVHAAQRSIPAYAGDPRAVHAPCVQFKVYPRLRGGSDNQDLGDDETGGLSPPTRGILS